MVWYSLFSLLLLAPLGSFSRASICETIQDNVSSDTKVYFPIFNELEYEKGIQHWAGSSSQEAECVVEPGTTSDVAKILHILGQTRTPFAVKGGGHATNPGFSSTKGVQITMSRFSGIDYNKAEQTVTLGAGLIWDDVYAALEPHGVSVLGGRVTGIGVAGFTLGGGYSWKANQHGLAIDTVVAFELVKPDGTIHHLTNKKDPDLFFALKGSSNNFGIVTRFTLKTFPQTQVWGGPIIAAGSQVDQITEATVDFSANVKDPKAQIITSYNFIQGQLIPAASLFYDGPNPPSGIFDKFLNITFLTRDVKTRSFLDLVQSSPPNATANQRAIYHTIPILDYTPSLLNAVVNESIFWGQKFFNIPGLEAETFVSYAIEPFLPDILAHTDLPSAYPPDRSIRYTPMNVYYAWAAEENDEMFHDAVKQSVNQLRAAAISEGQPIDQAPLYPNYAIFDTPVEMIYRDNLPRLQALKERHDPHNVMGLAGGFKI